MYRDRVVDLLRRCALPITLGALAACNPSAPPASPSPRPPTLSTVYRAALGISIPVPEGWSVDVYQGTSVTVESPPHAVTHGPRFTYERLEGTTPAVAFQDRCGGRPSSHAEGPTAVAGHAGSYQYLCAPRTFIGPEWTVLVPDGSTTGTWRITYLGAHAIGRDPVFTSVLAAFTAAAPAPPLGDTSGIAACTSSSAQAIVVLVPQGQQPVVDTAGHHDTLPATDHPSTG